MEQISLPTKIDYQREADARTGTLVIEPLYPGYGTTIGIALRRVLLSSLPGAAVTAVKIQNAPHEFTTLPKVQEDVLQIILNLKQLRVKVFSDEPVRLRLAAKGECRVTAADIEKDSNVIIVNPDLLIATLTARNAELEMDIWVSQGRGYVPTEAREKEKMEIGTIAIDSFFSPVHQVTFRIEPARVGQMTNYDKLIMNISTDGTITAAEAVLAAGKLLTSHLMLVSESLVTAAETAAADTTVTVPEETAVAPKKKRGRKPKVKEE
ncbi:DNA-directed RNA polymerase subunit alpha [Candidatus Uhrbacteria bacterium RIFCSPLOWO2_02_FULL_48_12]|uniref:DNA-directed RNA polymerase subunit alpha n=1 Tax=Candidatus Uhrbacteria bacterium RIFCSPLOWO2_02_FULL_48_12 TaxID=1802407 RepID=A0A1F7VAS4_9BACT|nr:MAG: DNA-directed RNA polymerase subunit alpha [Candidatus Uhrbacteria bacterium RIFCSPLOWO2_02_FULL_48_12]